MSKMKMPQSCLWPLLEEMGNFDFTTKLIVDELYHMGAQEFTIHVV